ncbi:MAG: GatB/YqeY domain-containing protein [Candidatus Margulisbacteria bacterium]|nr:GatB/YqeY domain-containing protein [Candidatus Margulisiibacteriota bacterium]MBU1867677.1 GatB/YqeY domain-containing protein [Candidatus Margulisiibacteriota bacterium]
MEQSELLKKINTDLMIAMKGKDEFRLAVLRMMKSKVLYVNARGEISEAEVIKILNKYAKELKESTEEFRKIGRPAEVEKAIKELAVVQEYLPKEMSAEEVKAAVTQTISALGAASIKEMGKVMKEITAKYPSIDGKLVSQYVREVLK